MIKLLVAMLVGAVGGAGATYWLMNQEQVAGLGEASPRPEVSSRVDFDWVLAEGELMQGTEDLNVPLGINVAIAVDNDLADTLIIDGYDISFELAPDSIVAVEFFTHEAGRFPMRLKSSGRMLGTLDVVLPQ